MLMAQLAAFWAKLTMLVSTIRFSDIVDILIVAYLIYNVIMLIRKTNSYRLAQGVLLILIALWLSGVLKLTMFNRILQKTVELGLIALVIIFQPELRRALAHIGRFKFNLPGREVENSNVIVKEMTNAMINLSKRKVGALVVIERETKLDEYFPTGTIVDAQITSALLENIFEPKTPLHDGAVIIRDGRIYYAACVLPLFSDPNVSKELGTRHRAALGVSNVSDSLTVVVSEETGVISYAEGGKLVRYVDKKTLAELLEGVFAAPEQEKTFASLFKRLTKDETQQKK